MISHVVPGRRDRLARETEGCETASSWSLEDIHTQYYFVGGQLNYGISIVWQYSMELFGPVLVDLTI